MTHLDQIESRLKEIDERCEKATPGPWKKALLYSLLRYNRKNYFWDDEYDPEEDKKRNTPDEDDADFVFYSRTDLPAVVKALRVMTEASKKILDDEWRPNTEDTLEQALSAIASILGGEGK